MSDPAFPNQFYILAFSSSTTPPITLSTGEVIPLAANGIFYGSLFFPSIFGLTNSQGFLNSNGQAQATWTVPNFPTLAYFTVYFAFVTINPESTQQILSISDAVPVTMLP